MLAFKQTIHTISYACIQANNIYYKEVLDQKMNKKLDSSHIYLTGEQYNQVKVSKSFYIPFNFSFHMTH
jgi:hypothetical protein